MLTEFASSRDRYHHSLSSDRSLGNSIRRGIFSAVGVATMTYAIMHLIDPQGSSTPTRVLEPRIASAECNKPYIDTVPTTVGNALGFTDRISCQVEVTSFDPKMNPHLIKSVTVKIPSSDLPQIPVGDIVLLDTDGNDTYEEVGVVVDDVDTNTPIF